MEERTNTRGGFDQAHGRYKIFNTVLNQAIKLIDLFEEAIEMKLKWFAKTFKFHNRLIIFCAKILNFEPVSLVKKGKKIAEKTDKMNEKITDQVTKTKRM